MEGERNYLVGSDFRAGTKEILVCRVSKPPLLPTSPYVVPKKRHVYLPPTNP